MKRVYNSGPALVAMRSIQQTHTPTYPFLCYPSRLRLSCRRYFLPCRVFFLFRPLLLLFWLVQGAIRPSRTLLAKVCQRQALPPGPPLPSGLDRLREFCFASNRPIAQGIVVVVYHTLDGPDACVTFHRIRRDSSWHVFSGGVWEYVWIRWLPHSTTCLEISRRPALYRHNVRCLGVWSAYVSRCIRERCDG